MLTPLNRTEYSRNCLSIGMFIDVSNFIMCLNKLSPDIVYSLITSTCYHTVVTHTLGAYKKCSTLGYLVKSSCQLLSILSGGSRVVTA